VRQAPSRRERGSEVDRSKFGSLEPRPNGFAWSEKAADRPLARRGDFEAKVLAAAEAMMDARISERVPNSLKPPGRGTRNA
jgi:hypothetical protein